MPTISVVVPIYNSQNTLKRCVDSILEQSYKDFELLLIDDGSTDNSMMMCEDYAERDSRVKFFHKSNGGAASARNLGLQHASGEWITFCDSDDFVYNGWLSAFADNCQNVDLVCQGIRYDQGAKDIVDVYIEYAGDISQFSMKAYLNNILGYTVIRCFKTSIIKRFNIRFSEAFILREDEEFIMRYMCYCKSAVSIPYIGYHYFIPDFNLKYTPSKDHMIQLAIALYQNALKLYNNAPNDHVKEYLNFYTRYFIKTFRNGCPICNLKTYRDTVVDQVFETNLHLIIKYLIYYDKSYILSTIIIYLYSIYVNSKCKNLM